MPIPHEPDQWMVFRRLNSRRLQEAVDAKVVKAQQREVARLQAIGPEGVQLLHDEAQRQAAAHATALADAKRTLGQEAVDKLQAAVLERQKAPGPEGKTDDRAVLARFDRDTLLRLGIVEWSYPVEPKVALAESVENDDGLDDATATWAYRQVLIFNDLLPSEAETALGN